MNLGLDLSLKLQQKLSYQMIQSLKLLQVNTLQLEQLIKQEIEMNPVLEQTEEQDEEQVEELDQKENENEEEELEVAEDEIDWEEFLEEGFDLGGKMSEERVHSDTQQYEPTPVHFASLEEHLLAQLSEKKMDDSMRILIEYIIGSLSADGYLRMTLQELAEGIEQSPYKLEEALAIVQRMDPPGVGSRNLKECLQIQLQQRGKTDTLSYRIISEAWGLFERVKVPDIARRFEVSPQEVQNAFELLKTLHPKPGYLIARDAASVIVPDLIVEKIDGELVVMLNDRSVPSLKINKAYSEMLRRGNKTPKDVKKYVREKLNGASWLIRSIEQRKSTMLKVMYAIIERQKEFFEKGPPHLNPLKLQDVAEAVEMHISTISRVTNGKYVQTSHGIFELKYFFSEAISRESEEGDVSAMRIKNRIRELIENENSKKPLSDQKISEKLTAENLRVARRTVAKYREQLKLLPARLRQKYD